MAERHLSEEDIQFVDDLVHRAGTLATEMRAGVGVHTKSSPTDLVTDADLMLSKMISEELSKRFPHDLVISEEDKHESLSDIDLPGRVWLFDPIDGTRNYVAEDGQWSSMVGLLVSRKPHYGWMYQPSTKTLFAGGKLYGSRYKNDDAPAQDFPQMSSLEPQKQIRLMIGWGDRRRHGWIGNLPRVEIVPSESMGLKIVQILHDGADVFMNLTGRVKLWDTAAPVAVALGVGMDVATVEGTALPFPLPQIQHGCSIIIGRPGSIQWALKYIDGRATRSVPKTR